MENNTKNSKESLCLRKQENRKLISGVHLKRHYQRPNAEKAKERTDHTKKKAAEVYALKSASPILLECMAGKKNY